MKASKELHDKAMAYADAADAVGRCYGEASQLAYLLLGYSAELEAYYACDKRKSKQVLLESSSELLRECIELAREMVNECE